MPRPRSDAELARRQAEYDKQQAEAQKKQQKAIDEAAASARRRPKPRIRAELNKAKQQ